MEMKPLVIYHGNCRDGFCAAWVVHKRYPNADFHEGFYGQDPPDTKGRDVIIVDFSYPLDVMNAIARDCKTLLVLDHHKTAKAALHDLAHSGLDHVGINFDMERSGAGMAWDHFFDGQPRPWIVDYVEDRDLWRWKLDESKEISAWIGILPYEFAAWREAEQMDFIEALQIGEAVTDKVQQYVKEVSKNTRLLHWEGHAVPVVNAPQVDISELLDHALEKHKPTFAVGWFQRADGLFQYSLRSRGDFDVSALAKKYGGGGHKNAAGFQLPHLIFSNIDVRAQAAPGNGNMNPQIAQLHQEALK